MGIRKFNADYLFTGKELLTSDAVLITDEYGMVTGISNLAEAGDGVEFFEGLITPGFINTHCHVELSHMKGKIPPGTGLIDFLIRVIRERNAPAEDILSAIRFAGEEMYDNGIVAVGDVCNTQNSLQLKSNSKINWFSFLEVIGFNDHDADARIVDATRVLNEFKNNLTSTSNVAGSLQHASISPHAPYSVSHSLFERINEASAGQIVTIHNQESEAENHLYLNGSGNLYHLYKNLNIDARSFEPSGKTSVQTYLPWLKNAAAIILVHNMYTSEQDMEFIRDIEAALYFCICINANRYIQGLNPPIELFRKLHCNITIGTDSYASNNQLNMLEEIKTIHHQFPLVPLAELLQWATLNGAKALGMDSKLGSFDKGKQPGIVLISNVTGEHVSASSTAKRLR